MGKGESESAAGGEILDGFWMGRGIVKDRKKTPFEKLFGGREDQVICSILGYDPGDFGRYRSAWAEMSDEKPVIVIHTRNGGGNRECWDDYPEGCDCTGCMMERRIPQLDGYLRDEDDEWDTTYANIYFQVPERYQEILGAQQGPGRTWEEFIAALKDPPEKADGVAQELALDLIKTIAGKQTGN